MAQLIDSWRGRRSWQFWLLCCSLSDVRENDEEPTPCTRSSTSKPEELEKRPGRYETALGFASEVVDRLNERMKERGLKAGKRAILGTDT